MSNATTQTGYYPTIDLVRIEQTADEPGRLFVAAVAQVSYQITNNGVRRLEWLRSGGLGVSADETPDYLREIAAEQIEELRDHLEHFGIVVTLDELRRAQGGAR